MFLAAFASLRSPESKAFYDRTRAEGKRNTAAVISLARRRCNVILAMPRTQQCYQPTHRTPNRPRPRDAANRLQRLDKNMGTPPGALTTDDREVLVNDALSPAHHRCRSLAERGSFPTNRPRVDPKVNR
jgi:hypothetical protein